MLVDKGGLTDVRTTHQRTPLHFASHKGSAECVEILLAHGSVSPAFLLFDLDRDSDLVDRDSDRDSDLVV